MAAKRTPAERRQLNELLTRDHTLNGAILFGLDGYVIEMQARAMEILDKPHPLASATKISGMARECVKESLDRIAGALAKLNIAESAVRVMVNLAPADLPKDGTWLDLPLAILMLQAAGALPDLAEYREGDYIIFGEVGLHGRANANCTLNGQYAV
ncbi:MAG TPA: magnesium chelatase domain-containing protein [Pirellulales bacterium]|nr:magnesium chelatase domain-containing protein [Pirellulales bacterium]